MSIVANVIRDLGIIGSHLSRISDFKLSFIRAVTLSAKFGRSKAWASPELAERFRRNQMVSRALDESMVKFSLAR